MHDLPDMQQVFSLRPKESISAEQKWKETLDKVAAAVVSVKFCHTSSFDAEDATTAEATGFVVDAKNGYILTNRHVAGPNPFWGRCIFENHEEVDVHVKYYDPVHDFGILRYDPESVKYMSVPAIPLRPDMVKVAEDIRLVGNDAGEKLSIQSGVISRLDRNAPEYCKSGYSDFNINYIQAAAGATGGSSGSPVVNIHGQAVAIQAGGRSFAATDYLLPLDRPLRALQCLQNGEPITRGTIQCQWKLKPFNECQGLGLTAEWEKRLRKAFPNEVGVLVAERIIPEGPSDTKIHVGDILIKVNEKLLAQFKDLDDILDSSVGGSVELLLQRRSKDIMVTVQVGDLYKITPNRIVSVAGASFQDLSYQRSMAHGVACKGVYLSDSSGSFAPLFDGCVIQKIDGKATPDLDTFIEVMRAIPDQTRVLVTYKSLNNPSTPIFTILCINRYWSRKISQFLKNDKTSIWEFTHLADAIPTSPPVPQMASSFVQLRNVPHTIAGVTKCFVKVEGFVPQCLNGSYFKPRATVGVVIDAEQGLVFVSRITVPHTMCDISITIADSVIVHGEVLFVHPLHYYALIKYDPKLVTAPLQSVKLSSKPVDQGTFLHFVGFNGKTIDGPIYTRTAVTDVCNLGFETSSDWPKLKAMNIEEVKIDTPVADDCGSGLLMNDKGIVEALWMTSINHTSYAYHGLASCTILPVISRVRNGQVPKLRFLSVEFEAITMSQARDMKISQEWINKVEVANPTRHQLFKVKKRTIQSDDSSNVLLEGDIILTLNGSTITRLSEIDLAGDAEKVDARVWRYGEEVSLKLYTVLADDVETQRAVLFCGAILQPPHHAARFRVGKTPSDVYVSSYIDGSPAHHYGLYGAVFITQVNGTDVCDLDSLLNAAKTIPDNTNFTLTTVDLSGIKKVMKMRKNDHFFPTKDWIKASPKWVGRAMEVDEKLVNAKA